MGFSVLRFWPFFRSVLRFLHRKSSVFRFWCLLRFADFLFFNIWFSVFGKNTSGFSDLVSYVGKLGSKFSVLMVLYAVSVLIEIYCGFAVLGDFLCGFPVSNTPQRPPPAELNRNYSQSAFPS